MASAAEKLEALRNDTAIILAEMKPMIDSAEKFQWNPASMGYLPVIRRAVLCRQYESLECILHLVQNRRGYAGVYLLRPACEELIWVKYLSIIDDEVANDLLLSMTQKEMFDSLIAQDHYAGRTETKKLGLFPYLKRLSIHEPEVRRTLSMFGTKLQWPAKSIESGTLPSMQWLAKATGMRPVYNFLYHASSRYVHFSPSELLRRAWGTVEEITIRSSNFDEYWSAFAIVWGQKLLTQTYLALHESLERDGIVGVEVDGNKIINAYQRINEFGLVPIITREELNWPPTRRTENT